MSRGLKIVFFLGGGIAAPHIVKSASEAVENLGNQVRLLMVRHHKEDLSPILKEFNPDLIVALDHTGIDDALLSQTGFFYCSWFVDHPLYFIDETHYNSFHLVSISDPSFAGVLEMLGWKRKINCPLAYDPKLFISPEKDRLDRPIDLSFVGTFPGSPEDLRKKRQDILKQSANPEMEKFLNFTLDAAIGIKKNMPEKNLWDVFRTVEESGGIQFLNRLKFPQIGGLLHLLDLEVDAQNKISFLKSLKGFNLKIFGNPGWISQNLNENVFCGEVEYGKALAEVYRKTKINLVLTRPQLQKGVNQRVFDIPGAGGFFLCDFRDELKAVFPSLWETISFRDQEELREKVVFFLSHDKEREDIAKQLHRCVKTRHTYLRRMNDFLGEVKEATGR